MTLWVKQTHKIQVFGELVSAQTIIELIVESASHEQGNGVRRRRAFDVIVVVAAVRRRSDVVVDELSIATFGGGEFGQYAC